MKLTALLLIMAMGLVLSACGEPTEEVENVDAAEVTSEEVETTEDVEEPVVEEVVEEVAVDEAAWTTTTLPEPWPQDFLVQSGMDIVSQEDNEGTLVLVAEFADDTEYGIFDTYDFYYWDGWEVQEGMSMSCMSDGASLTVYVTDGISNIHIDGDYVEGLFTLTYTLTPVQ